MHNAVYLGLAVTALFATASPSPSTPLDVTEDPPTPVFSCTGCDEKTSGEGGNSFSAEVALAGHTLHVEERFSNFSQNCSDDRSDACSDRTCTTGWSLRIRVTGGKAKVRVNNGDDNVDYDDVGSSWVTVFEETRQARLCGSNWTYSGYMDIGNTKPEDRWTYSIDSGCQDCNAGN